MMEMIRSWRIVSLAAWPRAMMDMMRAGMRAITSRKMKSFAIWSIAIIFIGMLTGAMAVMLPPMASIGVVAIIGVVLLWAMPDLHIVPDKLLRKMFFTMVVVQLCVPAYYAIDTGFLPWISVRRFFSLAVILLFALTVAGSQSARDKISETVRDNRLLALCAFGFFGATFISVITAVAPIRSFSILTDNILTWYVPLFACILVVRTEEDVMFMLKLIAFAGIFDSTAGLIEFIIERRYYFDIFPQSVLEAMLSSNPALQIIYSTSQFRNGVYRASSIYTVPLSFGEFAAMVGPIAAYFFLHGQKLRDRLLGVLAGTSSLVALFCSGARGGFIAFLVAMPVMLLLWTVRYSKENRGSLVGGIAAVICTLGFVAVLGLIAFSKRLSNTILGGGDTVSSTDARFVQWNMALPHVIANPVTGHGSGSSGELVGYFNPGSSIPTIDSYIITLLVDQGIPGFLLFFGTIGVGIWVGVKVYLGDLDKRATVGAPIACSLIAFGVYRLVLSQTENHTLMFLTVGLVFAVSKLAHDRLRTKRVRAPRGSTLLETKWARP